MYKHAAIKTTAGISLMAMSLGVCADLHTFGDAMAYYKVSGASTGYAYFLPSGATATDSVILLDLFQSGTVATWAYAMGGSIGAGQVAAPFTTGMSSSPAGGIFQKATGVITYITPAGISATTSSTSFYNGDTQELSLSFTQVSTVFSQACNMSFSAKLDTDDYLQFTNLSVLPANWPSATDDVYYRTKPGTSASDTASMASNIFNAYNASTTSSFYTFSAWTVPIAGDAANTFAVSAITGGFSKCNTAANNRTFYNGAGGVVGGKEGMMRLW
ncbi:MAG: hypothetical protein WC091_23220 [Sulfuricellaceae bacterium]